MSKIFHNYLVNYYIRHRSRNKSLIKLSCTKCFSIFIILWDNHNRVRS
nr:MAG TPA: hypothetical protein [Caudoviricetes sp.]